MLCHSFKEVESGVDTPSISQIMQEMKCGEEKQRFKKADTILIICKSVFLEFFSPKILILVKTSMEVDCQSNCSISSLQQLLTKSSIYCRFTPPDDILHSCLLKLMD